MASSLLIWWLTFQLSRGIIYIPRIHPFQVYGLSLNTFRQSRNHQHITSFQNTSVILKFSPVLLSSHPHPKLWTQATTDVPSITRDWLFLEILSQRIIQRMQCRSVQMCEIHSCCNIHQQFVSYSELMTSLNS